MPPYQGKPTRFFIFGQVHLDGDLLFFKKDEFPCRHLVETVDNLF